MPRKKKAASAVTAEAQTQQAGPEAVPDNVQPIAPPNQGVQMTQVDKLILANCSLLEQAALGQYQQTLAMINAQVTATADRVAQANGITREQLLRDFIYNHSIAEWVPRTTKAA